MKHCTLCGAALTDDAVRCPQCGLPLSAAQPAVPEETTEFLPCTDAATAQEEPASADTAEATAASAGETDAPVELQPGTGSEPAASAADLNEPAALPASDAAAPGAAASAGKIQFAQPPTAPPPPGNPREGRPAPGPHYSRTLPQQPDGGLTTAQYFWTLMLFAVPVVGLGFMLYWSFGSTTSPARRRLARASLIKLGVSIVTVLIPLIILIAVLFGSAQYYRYSTYDPYDEYYGYFEDYGNPGSWYGDSYGGFGGPNDWFDDFFSDNEPSRIY